MGGTSTRESRAYKIGTQGTARIRQACLKPYIFLRKVVLSRGEECEQVATGAYVLRIVGGKKGERDAWKGRSLAGVLCLYRKQKEHDAWVTWGWQVL